VRTRDVRVFRRPAVGRIGVAGGAVRRRQRRAGLVAYRACRSGLLRRPRFVVARAAVRREAGRRHGGMGRSQERNGVVRGRGSGGVAGDPPEGGGEAARRGGVGSASGSVGLVADGAGNLPVSGIPMGGNVGRERSGRLVPGNRVRLRLRVACGGLAGGRRGSAVEQDGSRRAVAPLAVGQVLPGGEPVELLSGVAPCGPDPVRGGGRAVAQGAVEAAGGRARGSGSGRMARRVVRRSRDMALRTDGNVHRAGVDVRVVRAAPEPRRVRRGRPVADEARHLRPAPGEGFPVADPAGGEAGVFSGAFRGGAVALGRGGSGGPARDRAVVTARGIPVAGDIRGPSREVRTVALGAGGGAVLGVGPHGGNRVPAAGFFPHPAFGADHDGGGAVGAAASCDPREGGKQDKKQDKRGPERMKPPGWMRILRHIAFRSHPGHSRLGKTRI